MAHTVMFWQGQFRENGAVLVFYKFNKNKAKTIKICYNSIYNEWGENIWIRY